MQGVQGFPQVKRSAGAGGGASDKNSDLKPFDQLACMQ
jgi:hypothetical protein